jgi:hypothetical protein
LVVAIFLQVFFLSESDFFPGFRQDSCYDH